MVNLGLSLWFGMLIGCVTCQQKIEMLKNAGLVSGEPQEILFTSDFVERLDTHLDSAVYEGASAGAEAIILIGGAIHYHQVAGFQTTIPRPVPLMLDTLFDLASLTKVVVTTTAIMMLVDRGEVELDSPAVAYLPGFKSNGKDEVTVLQLLSHTSGLPATKGLYRRHRGRVAFKKAIFDLELDSVPGQERVYSDLGFMVLGWMIEEVSGKRLDRFAKEEIFEPLGMENTFYRPGIKERRRTAATEVCKWRKKLSQGEVHDENAAALGGVAGHAGLFSTAYDLARFAQMILDNGTLEETRILSEKAINTMLERQPIPGCHIQALGWWYQREDGEPTLFLPSEHSFGHPGFTGTSIWIDPEYEAAVILLGNAIHPHREGADRDRLRKGFHAIVSEALGDL